MAMANCQGTIRGIPMEDFNPEADAAYLKYCMDGMGTKDTKLMTMVTDRTNEQRLAIAEAYEAEYGLHLAGRMKSETSGKYEKTLVALMTHPARLDAQQIRKAVEGWGTNEGLLNEIVCTRTGQELAEIREVYEEMYGESLIARLVNEASGDYEKYLVACLERRPPEDPEAEDDEGVAEAVEALYNAGEARWGTNESVFVDVLAGSTFARLQKIAQAYELEHEKTLMKVCIKELGGHFEDAVVLTIKQAMNPVALWSEKIQESMKGLGTDDSSLIRLIVSRSERDLLDIRNGFGTDFGNGTSLGAWIEGDTSGKFRKVLLSILNADQREPILVGVEDDEDDDKEDDEDVEEPPEEPVYEEPVYEEPAVEDDPPAEIGPVGTLCVALKSGEHGTYLSAQPDSRLEWNRDEVGDWERFQLEEVGDNKITLRSCHGLYVCADEGGNFVADREAAGPWETFDLVYADGVVALQTVHGRFISVQPDGRVETDREDILGWEQIQIVALLDGSSGGIISFKSCHGTFMSANDDGTVTWDKEGVEATEKFVIERHEDKLAFRSAFSTYLCAEGEQLVVNREAVGPWELFEVVQDNDQFSLRSDHGFFISAQEDGRVEVNREENQEWERFTYR